MIKEAIEYIVNSCKPEIIEERGKRFCVTSSGEISEIKPFFPSVGTLELNSLDSLVKMVKTEAMAIHAKPFYITVPTHLSVSCFGWPQNEERDCRRVILYKANATDVPGWQDNTGLKFDEAMIAIRTRFQETPDAQYVLKLLSDITTGSKVTYSDNGVATSIVTKTGVALQSNEVIRPIVKLRPYRTFQEIEQPESMFLIRINERGINFIEADGGMWKLAARKTIKAFLEEAFSEEIESGEVIVAL